MGSLVVTVKGGEGVAIGDKILVEIPPEDRHGNRQKSVRLRISAPDDVQIDRLDENGERVNKRKGE